VFNETFKLTGTLFSSGKKFLKKKMEFEVHERLTSDTTSNGEKIGGGFVDLGEFVSAESEVTSSAAVKLDSKKGTGIIRLTMSSTCLKDGKKGDDFSEVSTYTGVESEDDDATEDDGHTPRGKRDNKARDSRVFAENEELRDQILMLQRNVLELNSVLSESDADAANLVSDLQKERDDLRNKLKQAQIDNENLKEERDRAVNAQQVLSSYLCDM
jgi:hypothetical protein